MCYRCDVCGVAVRARVKPQKVQVLRTVPEGEHQRRVTDEATGRWFWVRMVTPPRTDIRAEYKLCHNCIKLTKYEAVDTMLRDFADVRRVATSKRRMGEVVDRTPEPPPPTPPQVGHTPRVTAAKIRFGEVV